MIGIKAGLDWLIATITGDLAAAYRAEVKMKQRARETRTEVSENDIRMRAGLQAIRQHYTEDENRRKLIEDKAKTILVGISTATSIVLAGLNYILSSSTLTAQGGSWRILGALLLAGAMWSYGLGIISSLRALAIREVYRLTLEDEASSCEQQKVQILLSCLDRNHDLTRIRSNYTHASMVCLRNGTLLLLAFIILTCVLTIVRVKVVSYVFNKWMSCAASDLILDCSVVIKVLGIDEVADCRRAFRTDCVRALSL